MLAVIQARLGSTRFPRKVLADCHGMSVLERVVQRVRRAELVHRVVVAIPFDDVELAEFCDARGISTVTGPERDVQARYVEAMEVFNARACLRVTSDCPLIDPVTIDRVIEAWMFNGRLDYVCNNEPRTYPHGYDCEVVTLDALAISHVLANGYQREHVTEYIRCHPEQFQSANVESTLDLPAHWRLTVDYPADLELIRALYKAGGNLVGSAEIRDLMAGPEMMRLMRAAKEAASDVNPE